ncbi:MAG: hypothetical protein EKK63_17650 [Acinetobacter sp.]|uniref:hypothetical protein n=1 Tax=Acinetobacter sp. TaxID=472 RepID=UPI000F92C887|nr:hypothetical protein [Acinetobacter sp.]RUP36344.1 MAG: hypothetical protein EKK63_17650 [Acinetobacter sp.]
MFYPSIKALAEEVSNTSATEELTPLITIVPVTYVRKNEWKHNYNDIDLYADLLENNTSIIGDSPLIGELPGIDFTGLQTSVVCDQYIQAIHFATSETVKGWDKSKSLLRVGMNTSGIGFICGNAHSSWTKLLVACVIKARQHSKIKKMSVFNINYGKPTELGTEIIISACEMITGGKDALRVWLKANFDNNNNLNCNLDALIVLLSEVYGIPLRIMDAFITTIHCIEYESRGIEWIIPRLAQYLNLTGQKYTGLFESNTKL